MEKPMLEVRHLSKTFGGTRALDDVALTVQPGEVHALIGHNGSGKSTLIKVLAGYHLADEGAEAWLDGRPLSLSEGGRSGHGQLRFVDQDLGLVPQMSALENLALRGGFARSRLGNVDWKTQTSHTEALLQRFGERLDVHRAMAEATPVERTIVAIAAALQGWTGGAGVLVLDEPTAVLPMSEVERLFQIVREVAAQGTSVIYVSHRLDEIFQICDNVTVLRGGHLVATASVPATSKAELVSLMLGPNVDPDYRSAYQPSQRSTALLSCERVSGQFLDEATLEINKGEIVGLAGRRGSGREELPYLLSGMQRGPASGVVRGPGGRSYDLARRNAKVDKVVLLPEDRGTEGVIAGLTVKENITLSVVGRLGRPGRLDRAKEAAAARGWLADLGVGAGRGDEPIGNLSGGNQQKVLLGRCLAQDPEVLVLCEPTAGVDIGARNAIYELVAARAEAGLTVLVSSSDVGDLVAMCTRVIVFEKGRPVAELRGDQITEQAIVHSMEAVMA